MLRRVGQVVGSIGAAGFVGLFSLFVLDGMSHASGYMWWGGVSVLVMNGAGLVGMLMVIWTLP